MFLIAGITGRVGGAAARALLAEGRPVRALVRDTAKAAEWRRDGVDLLQGDLADSAALATALEGVEAAFLMLPPVPAPAPDFPEAGAIIASYRAALERVPPRRVVVLSSIGSERSSGLGLITATHRLEQGLGGLGLPLAFVRAGGFLENYLYGLRSGAESGVFPTFRAPTDRPMPMVASEDIGAEVARLLASEFDGRRIIELGTRWSPDQLAAAMGAALGREVKALAIPREGWAAALEQMGFAPGTTAEFEAMEEGFNSGWIDFGDPAAEAVAATITPTEFFAGATRA